MQLEYNSDRGFTDGVPIPNETLEGLENWINSLSSEDQKYMRELVEKSESDDSTK